ncbi:hypothetical protein A8L45_21325 [Veronia pacifica]|uniref:DUF3857 domain-containing protein n=1 Tax=Veronia pacifica TaxID=1080227 RepID=A0A1C3E9Q4_9GAMM|nr:hypothetical protein A8L45_21325 [Veronia pacifica]
MLGAVFIATNLFATNTFASKTERVDWQLAIDNADKARVSQYLTQSDKPAEMRQVLRQYSFDVYDDQVSRIVTLINYYPKFTDIENYGSQSIYFNRNTQRVSVLSAVSVSPSGTFTTFDPQKARLRDTDTYNTFTDGQELVMPLPALEEGGLSIIKYKLITDRNAQEMDWATNIWTENNYEIENFSLRANWHGNTVMRWKQRGSGVKCEERARTLECKGQSISAFSGDEQIMWRDHIYHIALGGLDSWDEVSSRTATFMQKAMEDTKGLDDLVSSLTDHTPEKSDKISKLLDFVARDIRYVSMSETGHAVTPHAIHDTIKNRYGDCKDKSTLLKAMLDKIGIKGELRLVATQRAYPSGLLLPSMTAFDHIVVCFTLGEQEYCLDPTDTATNWQVTPNWIQGKVSLPVNPDYIPHRLPTSVYRWQMSNKTKNKFDEKGGQYEKQTREYFGEYASYYRKYLMSKNDEGKQSFLTEEYKDTVTDLSEPDFSWTGVDEMSFDLEISSENTLPAFLDVSQPLNYTEGDAWIKKELGDMRLQNTDYGEYFSGIKLESDYEYDLNNLWKLKTTPPSLFFQYRFGSLIRKTEKLNDGRLRVNTKVDIVAQWIDADEIALFNRFLDILERESSIHLTGDLIEEPSA